MSETNRSKSRRPSGVPVLRSLGAGAMLLIAALGGCISDPDNYYGHPDAIPSKNANLAGIHLSEGVLSPAFDPDSTRYTDTVSNTTTSIRLSPVVSANGASVSTKDTGAVLLAVGSNIIPIVVTAQDSTVTKTYLVDVIRRASSTADLAALTLSSGTLSPTFAASVSSYSATVPFTTSTVTVNATLADTSARIMANGNPLSSGTASSPLPLNVGTNSVALLVQAQDGTVRNYAIIVTRSASANANLAGLQLSSGTLSPAFDTATSKYAVSVAGTVSSIAVTPTLADANATVSVNGTTVPSGSASDSIPLDIGANEILVRVEAQDGTVKTCSLTVTREVSRNAYLAGLRLSSGTLSPTFDSSVTKYSASVDGATSFVNVTPTTAVPSAAVRVNGTAVLSGNASDSIALAFGSNDILVEVTAQDGSTRTCSLTVTRAALAVKKPTVVYHLDNDLLEAGGSGNTGVQVGNPLFSASGKSNQCIANPTLTDFVFFPGGTYDLSGDYTTALWVKTTSSGDLLMKQGADDKGSDGHGSFFEVKSWVQANGTVKVELGSSTAWTFTDVISTAKVNDGNWHFVATVVSGKTLKVYVDDKAAVTNTVGSQGRLANTNSAITLGGMSGNTSSAPTALLASGLFSGSLDEVYVYDKALTDDEITALYTASK